MDWLGSRRTHHHLHKPTADGVPPAARESDQERKTVMAEQNTSRPGRARLAVRGGRQPTAPGKGRHPRWIGWLGRATVVAAALVVAACRNSSSGSGSSASAPPSAGSGAAPSGSTLKTATISGATVLTNAKGFTLYSFAPDTRTASKCNGTRAQLWRPVKGPPRLGAESPESSARSPAPTAQPRPRTTGTRSTLTSRTPPPARPRAMASTHPAASGTR